MQLQRASEMMMREHTWTIAGLHRGALLGVKFAARLHVKAGQHFNVARRNPLHGPAIRATFGRDGHPFRLDRFLRGLLVGDAGVVGLGPIFWESVYNGAATDGF